MMVTSWTNNPTGLNTARYRLAGVWNTNSSISIWWCYYRLIQQQQKNMMVLSWTNNPTGLNTARRILAGAGTQTAALAFGGAVPVLYTGATEEYNGSSWTSVKSLV
jgi:hypothetical protein